MRWAFNPQKTHTHTHTRTHTPCTPYGSWCVWCRRRWRLSCLEWYRRCGGGLASPGEGGGGLGGGSGGQSSCAAKQVRWPVGKLLLSPATLFLLRGSLGACWSILPPPSPERVPRPSPDSWRRCLCPSCLLDARKLLLLHEFIPRSLIEVSAQPTPPHLLWGWWGCEVGWRVMGLC